MVIKDKDLGEIRLVKNVRAKRIIVRKKDHYFQLTHPPTVSLAYIEKIINEMKPRLLKLEDAHVKQKLFTPQTQFETFSFKIQIIEAASVNNFYTNLKNGLLSISCPANTDFEDECIQAKIRYSIDTALRYEAKRLLPERAHKLSLEHKFTHADVKINKSKTRWGSCSSKKNINLSFHCMLLPEYLIDFVILHELCHTLEMNHGERFWTLLDNVSGGRAKELTSELRLFNTSW